MHLGKRLLVMPIDYELVVRAHVFLKSKVHIHRLLVHPLILDQLFRYLKRRAAVFYYLVIFDPSHSNWLLTILLLTLFQLLFILELCFQVPVALCEYLVPCLGCQEFVDSSVLFELLQDLYYCRIHCAHFFSNIFDFHPENFMLVNYIDSIGKSHLFHIPLRETADIDSWRWMVVAFESILGLKLSFDVKLSLRKNLSKLGQSSHGIYLFTLILSVLFIR